MLAIEVSCVVQEDGHRIAGEIVRRQSRGSHTAGGCYWVWRTWTRLHSARYFKQLLRQLSRRRHGGRKSRADVEVRGAFSHTWPGQLR